MSAARRFGNPTDGRADKQTKLRSAAWWMVAALAVVLGSGCELAAPEIRGYAIVFGASEYDNLPPLYSNNLPAVANDATAITNLLENQGWEVSLYRDGEASKAQLQESIAEIPKAARKNGLVLIYYAGHGLNDNIGQISGYPEQYLVPVPGIDMSGNLIFSEFISPSFIFYLLAEYNVRHPLIILDSCHSGGLIGESGVFDGTPDDYNPWSNQIETEYAFSQIYSLATGAVYARFSYIQSEQAIVIAAAGAPETSWESPAAPYNGHGVFTWHLLHAATDKKADSNGDGYLSTSEIYANVRAQLDIIWNTAIFYDRSKVYMPRLSGSHRDYLLFKLP